MSSSKPWINSFRIIAAAVIVFSGAVIILALPVLSTGRHRLEQKFIARGDRQTGLKAIAWYGAAREIAPHDPTPAVKQAKLNWEQGSGEEAVAILARYNAPEALVLRGQYLVQLERYDEAEAVLRPLQGNWNTPFWGGASTWMGIALAEQGKVSDGIRTIEPIGVEILTSRDSPLGLMEQEVSLAHRGMDQGQMSAEAIADGYAKQGMIQSAQRVLAQNHVDSLSSWLLRAQLDQARVTPNWQEVEGDYEQALAADPSNPTVLKELRSVAQRNNDAAELQKLDQLTQLLPAK